MHRYVFALIVICLSVMPTVLTSTAGSTIYVNCQAASPGNGSPNAPFRTVTNAVALARNQGGGADILVAAGECAEETLPILLDVRVRIRGAQNGDSLVTVADPPDPATTFFVVTADDVRIEDVVIDGKIPLQGDVSIMPLGTPVGVSIVAANDYELTRLTIRGADQGIISQGSSGRIRDCDLLTNSGMFINGGPAGAPAVVEVIDNVVAYRVNGIAVAGSAGFGTTLRLTVTGNQIVTSFTNTGPTNPAALRVSPAVTAGGTVAGFVEIEASGNVIGGSAKYGIMIHAGQPVPGGVYTGDIEGAFKDNVVASSVVNRALITFTNARNTVVPTPPLVQYLTDARFDLEHDGELTNALIDHPQFHPMDHPLGNVLLLNKNVIAFQTFVGGAFDLF